MQAPTPERELPMLAGIAGFFRWIEELLNILNGPLLMFGAGIALVDLLTDGALTSTDKWLLFAWAISQALGIDLQLLACFARARMAMLRQHYWPLVGWIVLGIPLAIATWQAGYVYALQQSEHISESAALAEAGMDRRTWLAWRVGLAVLLVCLAGWTRYVAPRINAQQSAEEERQQLEADLMLEPLRAQKRAIQARGARSVVAAAFGRETRQPQPHQEPPQEAVAANNETPASAPLPPVQFAPLGSAPLPPFDAPEQPDPDDDPPPASRRARKRQPAQAASALPGASYHPTESDYSGDRHAPIDMTRSRAARRAKKRVVREGLDARKLRQRNEAYAILDGEPGISNAELARRVGCGPRQAKTFKQHHQAQQAARQAVQ